MSAYEEYLYIDYENVQDVNVDAIKKTMKVMIVVGEDQTKVPINLVQKTQPFGKAVEWIRVNGKGRNSSQAETIAPFRWWKSYVLVKNIKIA